MKRDIACEKCSLKYHGYPASNEGPEERVKKVKGTAMSHYNCDSCNAEINKGDNCVAISVFSDRNSYFVWEDEYIERKVGN